MPYEDDYKMWLEKMLIESNPDGVMWDMIRTLRDATEWQDEPQTEYERASEQREHDILYEPTYNPEDGSM